MSNRSDDSWVGVVILVSAGLCAYGVWQFSNTFGLDMATGFSVIGRLVVFAVLAGAALYSNSRQRVRVVPVAKGHQTYQRGERKRSSGRFASTSARYSTSWPSRRAARLWKGI